MWHAGLTMPGGLGWCRSSADRGPAVGQGAATPDAGAYAGPARGVWRVLLPLERPPDATLQVSAPGRVEGSEQAADGVGDRLHDRGGVDGRDTPGGVVRGVGGAPGRVCGGRGGDVVGKGRTGGGRRGEAEAGGDTAQAARLGSGCSVSSLVHGGHPI